jgi:H/ACA ribonucleoprotein complex non-core subunit NAF1
MAERILEEDVVGRPAKKARLEPPITDLPDTPIDDMDDTSIYGTPSIVPSPRAAQGGEVANTGNSAEGCSEPASLEGLNNGIPGLGLLGSPTQEIYYQAPTPESDRHDTNLELTNQGEERVDAGVALPKHSSLDLDSENQVNEGAIDVEESIGNEDSVGTPDLIKLSDGQTKISTSILDFTKESSDKALIAIPDPEFLRAAEVNRDNENAEWQFDSSDAKTPSSANTSDTSGSSDSSEADSEDEDDYPLLDPDEQAKILMQGDDGSDGEGGNRKGKGGTGMQLRTRNEIEDVKVAKPDVSITSEMKIEELGEIDKIIDNLVLVKAKVSGEYQVLDSGSILCFEDRRVMGVVGETLGRVQQPLYSVAFNSATEIAEEGVTIGTKVFYVEQHSSYVFTQPLKAMKGSDASNLHDEEVGEDELEFSDDEAEADYRRRVKLEKQSMRDAKNLGNGFSGQQKPKGGRRESSKYRDMGKAQVDLIKDTDGDDLYTPLARPTNLHELIGKGGATQEAQKFRSPTERSTSGGRGKDRDRAGRGNRCERGGRRGDRQGSAKGTHDYRPPMERFGGQDPSPSTLQFAGNANTFNSGPQSPSTGISYFPPQQPTQYSPHNTPSQFQQPFPVIYEHQPNYSWTQPPIPPQHLFAHFTTSQGYYPQSPGNAIPSPGGTLPPGSFVNPAFFRNQQQSPWVHHQQPTTPSHQQPQSGATRMSPEAEAAFKAAQERLDILKELSGVSGASGRDQAG